MAAAQIFHPIEAAGGVLRFYREFSKDAPDELAIYTLIVHMPPVDPFPAAYWGKPAIVLVACHCGPVDEGKAALEPLLHFGDPVLAVVDAMPYVALQQSFDAGTPAGERYYWKAHHLDGLADEVLDTVAEYTRDLPGEFTIVGIEPLGGAFGRVDPAATAFAYRHAPYTFGIWTGWSDPAKDEQNMAWTRRFYDAMAPFGTGAYVNYLDQDEGGRVEAAYGSNFSRMVEVKKRWDPDNLFRMNQNISPGE